MDKFTYNMFYEIDKPTVVLSTVAHKHYGVLENIDFDSFQCNFNMNSAQEISFDVYKFMDEHECSLWSKLISFKYIYIPQHHEYYKIDVTLDQDDKTVKHITGTSAGEWELSNRKIQSMEVNTANDLTYYEQYNETTGKYEELPEPTNTKATRLYNPDDVEKSLLHRTLKDRAPDWKIVHVDDTVAKKERMFSVSNQTIYDFLTNSVAQELDILFKFDSVNREISVYDLLTTCNNVVDGEICGERGNFTDICPKCGCTDKTKFIRGYGEDSHIYISAHNYANRISVDGDEGNVKNCFRIMGGDDLMTATVKNCTPSGSEYIYQFSEADYDDMPDELTTKMRDYMTLMENYEKGNPPATRPYAEITKDYYNALTEYYYYKTSMMPRTCPTTVEPTGKIDHWRANTGYNVGQTCYVITLPSYCYLVCVETTGDGITGSVEFDATNVIPSDNSDEHVYIQDNNVKWEVIRNGFTMPTADQTLKNIIKPYIARSDTVVYFENDFPAGIDATPQSFTSINKYVKDLLATVVNPLFKIDILNDGNNVSTWTAGWQSGDINRKHGRLNFYIRITNTTDPKDTASVEYNQARLTIKCAIANTLSEYQKYMQELVEKQLDLKDENYTSLWQTEKRKNDSVQLSSRTATVNCGFVPQYIVIQFIHAETNYTVVRNYDGTATYIPADDPGGTITINSSGQNPSQWGFTFNSNKGNDTIFYTAISDSLFATTIQQYSYDLLQGFADSYDACKNVLFSNHVTSEEASDFHGVDLYRLMYAPYNHKIELLRNEIVEREGKIKEYYNNPKQKDEAGDVEVGGLLPYDPSYSPGKIQQLDAEMTEIHTALNLQNYLYDEEAEDPNWMWHTLFNYIREGEYQNSNYISDGLSNNVLVEYATELLDKGAKELKKATELQYSMSDDLINLLNTEDFAPFRNKFNLGDFIVCGVGDNKDDLDIDNQNYKLRLISLSYSYGSPESVSVTFANVTKIKNYFSDTQDILAQAKSMGSSYATVTHQVEKNTDASNIVTAWTNNGLNSSLTRIMNNNREEVTYNNNGIIVKEYDYNYDEGKDNAIYGDDQLRITHDIIAFTTDNWKSASLGLGRQKYKYYDDENVLRDGEDYGLIAKFVDAGYIHGSQFIGGATYSEATYSDGGTIKPVSKINWNTGEFSLAKGKLVYSGNDFTLQANLVVKDTNNYDLFNANVDNHSVTIGGFTVNKQSLYNGTSSTTSATDGVYLGTDGIRNQKGSKYTQITNGKITSNDVDLSGKITSTNGEIGGWKIDSTSLYNSDDPDPNLAANGGVWLRTYDNSIVSTENYTGNIRLKTRIKGGYTEYYCKTGSNTEKLICTLTAKGSANLHGTVVTNGFHIDAEESNYIGIIRPGNIFSMSFDGGNISVSGYTQPVKVFDTARFMNPVSMSSLTIEDGNGTNSGASLDTYRYNDNIRGLTTNKMFISGNGIMVDDIGSAPALGQLELFVGKSTSADWNKGVILRNDGTNFYFLKRNGTSWDTMRPFRFNLSSGDVIMGHNVGIDGGLTVAGNITSTTGTVSGAVVKSNDTIVSDSGPNCRFTTGSNPGIIRQAASSSKRYKHDIKSIENNELDPHRLYKLTVKQFKYNDNYLDSSSYRYGKDVIGFVAEDVAEIYPIGADYNLDKDKNIESVEDWNIRYIVPPMLKLIQEQHMEIEELKQQILMLINK